MSKSNILLKGEIAGCKKHHKYVMKVFDIIRFNRIVVDGLDVM